MEVETGRAHCTGRKEYNIVNMICSLGGGDIKSFEWIFEFLNMYRFNLLCPLFADAVVCWWP